MQNANTFGGSKNKTATFGSAKKEPIVIPVPHKIVEVTDRFGNKYTANEEKKISIAEDVVCLPNGQMVDICYDITIGDTGVIIRIIRPACIVLERVEDGKEQQ